ncbi:ABC transporter permease [Fodinicurvata halophila]|uniref:ABC transporter permease n=1 Tax=Fodinicurvata halophila TaxID=1419723 RepID=A0ABV8UFP3_9PROT
MRASLSLAARLARREMRGGLKGFRIFLACLVLGVAAIAGVQSLSQALMTGLERNGRTLMGGEVELRLIHRAATEEEESWLRDNSARFSHTTEMRAMVRNAESSDLRRLAELKAVDSSYPLYGALQTEPAGEPASQLAEEEGLYGTLVDRGVLDRLELEVGDEIELGQGRFEIRGVITREPDRTTRAFTLGPRVMISQAGLAQTGLAQPGSLIYHHYRLDLPEGESLEGWKGRLNEAFPDAGWRVSDLSNAAPGLDRFVHQITIFMTLVGLTSLLVGGVGIANAVRAFLQSRQSTIATMKCLGAPARLVFMTYLIQILVLALAGIVGGLLIGAMTPLVFGPILAERLNYPIATGVYPYPLLLATAFGILTTLVFSLWPLSQAQKIPAAALFRGLVSRTTARPSPAVGAAILVFALALIAIAVVGTDGGQVALGFVGGAIGALLAFRVTATGIAFLARKLPRSRRPGLRLAVANLYRPGAATGSVITSLGLGLTVLVAIALVEGNLKRQVLEDMPEEAPGFYFIDIQADQIDSFVEDVRNFEGVEEVNHVPMLRGRISEVNGVAPEDMDIPEDIRWVFRGDRGLTWTAEPPENTTVTEGEWWPADYDGPPLVSLDNEVGELLDIGPGDEMTINVLGRNIEVEIANLREIDWAELSINFVMIFSPGMLESAPQSHIATVRLDPEQELALERMVTDRFPNVSPIRVKEALGSVAEILRNAAAAVTATGSVTLLAGLLVLAGAVAAGQQRRIYDSVVLKVLGATRRDVARAYLMEFSLLGASAALVAVVFGTLGAWAVLVFVMRGEFHFLPWQAAITVVAAVAVTLVFGFVGTWRALSQKAAPLMRND